jgi:hypothetical protein
VTIELRQESAADDVLVVNESALAVNCSFIATTSNNNPIADDPVRLRFTRRLPQQ